MAEAASPMLNAALRYADLGYRVLPCIAGTKRPRTQHGLHEATSEPDQIDTWWTQRRSDNIAIQTDGLIVLDIDGVENPWLADEPDRELDLANATCSITPRGGRHFFFQQPRDRTYRCSSSQIAPHVDVRATGGYVVVAPSVVLGRPYRWLDGSLDIGPEDLPEPPDWLLALFDDLDAKSRSGGATGIGGDGQTIPEGQRNSTLTSLAGTMRRVGMSRSEILAAINQVNAERCRPPLPDREVERIAASVARYEPDAVATALVEDHYEQDRVESSTPSGAADPGPLPEHLLSVPGLISDVIAFMLETAPRPQPVLSLAAAISLQAILAARKVRDDRGNRTNVYCVSLAHSGAGKDHPRKVVRRVLYESGLELLEATDEIASDAGLVAVAEAQPACLFQIDEFGRFLRTIGDPKKAPHLFNALGTLMKLYSSADTIFRGKAYADPKRNRTIDQPCVCLHGSSVPEHFYESLTADSMSDGFVARLLIFESLDTPRRRRVAQQPIPSSIVDAARWWGAFSPGGNLRDEHPQPMVVATTSEAGSLFDAFADEIDLHLQSASAAGRSLWARAEEKACRLALIHACSACRETPVIDEAAARWACELSSHLTRRVLYLASQWVSEGQFDAKQKRVLRAIRDAGGEIARRDLSRRTQWLNQRERQEVIENLKETGLIVERLDPTSTRPKVRYALA